MIVAWHLIWTCYGWWFPNDLRGSWSAETWVPQIKDLGPGHLGRRPRQPAPAALRDWLAQAQAKLKHKVVVLDGRAALAAANAIKEQVRLHRYVLRAFAVLPEHTHVVVLRHEHPYERIVQAFKSVSSRAVREPRGMHQGREKRDPVWSKSYWVRYLDNEHALRNAIRYVEQNPQKEGLPEQHWSFVRPA